MEEKTRLEDIEGFNELSEIEQEYFRVMQGEAEFRTAHHRSPSTLEIVLQMIAWTIYIIYSICSETMDVITLSAVVFLLSDIFYLYDRYFRE